MFEPSYDHTQKAPWYLLLFAFAALFFTVAWVTRAEPAVPAILVVAGLLMAMLAFVVRPELGTKWSAVPCEIFGSQMATCPSMTNHCPVEEKGSYGTNHEAISKYRPEHHRKCRQHIGR